MDAAAANYDYIIVGAGTAGCLLANRLSADRNVRVLLLEAGGKDNYHWIHIPVGYLYLMGNPRTDWGFTTAPEPGLNGRSLAYPRGRAASMPSCPMRASAGSPRWRRPRSRAGRTCWRPT